MFGLMKHSNSQSGDTSRVKGSILGSTQLGGADKIDPAAAALVQLCAAALPQMSGAVMTGLERALKIEPRQKPALRKFIADSYSAPQSAASTLRRYKRAASPRRDDYYRLAARLCEVAKEAQRTDSATLSKLINTAKAMGLSKDEVLSLLQKARLTA